jgi:hypothetical protein
MQEQKRCFIFTAAYRIYADMQVTQLFGRKQVTFPTRFAANRRRHRQLFKGSTQLLAAFG